MSTLGPWARKLPYFVRYGRDPSLPLGGRQIGALSQGGRQIPVILSAAKNLACFTGSGGEHSDGVRSGSGGTDYGGGGAAVTSGYRLPVLAL